MRGKRISTSRCLFFLFFCFFLRQLESQSWEIAHTEEASAVAVAVAVCNFLWEVKEENIEKWGVIRTSHDYSSWPLAEEEPERGYERAIHLNSRHNIHTLRA
ncbi:hypothetical protein KC365_g104 [Hortaea werneckii]|nr:hypothetical protein KC365_g104 [Hortaea werneckii]